MRAQDPGQREIRGGVIWNVVCRPDRVVGESSYCKIMQCVTSCRRSIVWCEHSSNTKQRLSNDCENHAVWSRYKRDDTVQLNHSHSFQLTDLTVCVDLFTHLNYNAILNKCVQGFYHFKLESCRNEYVNYATGYMHNPRWKFRTW